MTIDDLARSRFGGRAAIEVIAADTGEDITARVLSRALASGKAPVAASTDTLARILRAGSEAAETVADVVEKVGASGVAASAPPGRTTRGASPRRSRPSRAGSTTSARTSRGSSAGLVEKGRLTWDEGARLRDDVGLVFRESLADLAGSVKDLGSRVGTAGQPEFAREIAEIKTRLAQLETLAQKSFPTPPRDRAAAKTGRASASQRRRHR